MQWFNRLYIIILLLMLFFSVSYSMRNPAAVFCKSMGYEYTILDTPKGQIGRCILPDNSNVNSWDFFMGKVKREYHYCTLHGMDVVYKDDPKFQIIDGNIKSGVFCVSHLKSQDQGMMDVIDMMGLNLSEPFPSLVNHSLVQEDLSLVNLSLHQEEAHQKKSFSRIVITKITDFFKKLFSIFG